MSKDWFQDIKDMHAKYGFDEWVEAKLANQDTAILEKHLRFRLMMLAEEYNETVRAALVTENAEDVVDGLIDMIVFAIGTLDLLQVDAHKAWDEIYTANMNKQRGVKPGRPNAFGLPDLLKPAGWTPPKHTDNVGYLNTILK